MLPAGDPVPEALGRPRAHPLKSETKVHWIKMGERPSGFTPHSPGMTREPLDE